jgi:hypothetical protein
VKVAVTTKFTLVAYLSDTKNNKCIALGISSNKLFMATIKIVLFCCCSRSQAQKITKIPRSYHQAHVGTTLRISCIRLGLTLSSERSNIRPRIQILTLRTRDWVPDAFARISDEK